MLRIGCLLVRGCRRRAIVSTIIFVAGIEIVLVQMVIACMRRTDGHLFIFLIRRSMEMATMVSSEDNILVVAGVVFPYVVVGPLSRMVKVDLSTRNMIVVVAMVEVVKVRENEEARDACGEANKPG